MPQPQCSAKSKRSQQQCRGWAMKGRPYCRMHGGKNLRGAAHPNFTNGSTSRYLLPRRMRDDYEAARIDPKLLELNEEIAVVIARVKDLQTRVDSGESGHLWQQLQHAYADLGKAETSADQLAAIATLGNLIKRGASDYAAWEEVGKQTDRQQRLVESQRKRAVELHQMVSYDDFSTFLFAIIDFWRERITDRDILMDFQRLLETRTGTGSRGGAAPFVVSDAGDTETSSPA